ncbi:lysin A [Microbacterium phage YellowPanda]|uniref:Lysin A n=2 Tax=Tinytimothyvirus tinytimothy TaxID=2845596 RepID=A0A5Q2WM92_9CAUD|nr:lysin A [Microbacterium phage TinyTimothy]QDF16990.1 lysin A [Microbacterium phage TinyTimothy]QGH78679.1 lysin A [Microbacterium phage Wesak]
MGYLVPASAPISCSWQCHRDRPKPSTEPGTDHATAYGTSIRAAGAGTIVDSSTSTSGGTGRYVTIDLDDGRRVRYLHLSQVLKRSGRVNAGDIIAKSGASGFGKEWGYGAHVHTTLFPKHAYVFGTNATLDFMKYVGNSTPVTRDQTVANQQNFLNVAQGEKLVEDGILGGETKAAIGRYQTYLRGRGWYNGESDGIWGAGTQAGHEKRYAEWVAATQAPPSPQYHNVTLDDIASIGNVEGLQKIARLYVPQKVDNQWGPNSKKGLQQFLNVNYGGSLVNWLRSKWGYVGNDQFGPVMKAALQRANDANKRAL